MDNFVSALPTLLLFIGLLCLLAWLSRQISIFIQLVVQRLTNSVDLAAVALFLIFLPGTLVHEGSHWFVGWVLGLKPSKFRVWPKKRGKYLGLGSVSVRSGGVWKDTLVGLAPLLIGTLLTAFITYQILGADRMATMLARGQLWDSVGAFRVALQQPDGALWCYLLFAIANAMMPSASDRAPARPLPFYILLALVLYFLAGFPMEHVSQAAAWLSTGLRDINSAFIFVIAIDAMVLAVLVVIEQLLSMGQLQPAEARKRSSK